MKDQELRELVRNYRPNTQVTEAMKQVSLLVTVGPSASGKTTLMKALAEADPNFHFVVGETSRQPRPGEQDGVDLIFRTQAEILEELKEGKLTQVVIGPNGDLYSTRVSNFPTQGVGLFPLIPLGVRQFRALPLHFFATAFIVPATFELWQKWLAKQAKDSGWTDQQLQGRLKEAKASYEFALSDRHVQFVLNDETSRAVQRLLQVANDQTPDDENLAKATAKSNYRRLLREIDIK